MKDNDLKTKCNMQVDTTFHMSLQAIDILAVRLISILVPTLLCFFVGLSLMLSYLVAPSRHPLSYYYDMVCAWGITELLVYSEIETYTLSDSQSGCYHNHD